MRTQSLAKRIGMTSRARIPRTVSGYDRALSERPKATQVWLLSAVLVLRLGQGVFSRALTAFFPTNPSTLQPKKCPSRDRGQDCQTGRFLQPSRHFRRPDKRNYAGKESCALFRRNPLVSVCDLTPSCSHEYWHASTYPNGQNSLNETRAVPADPSAYHLSVNTPCPDRYSLTRIRSVRAQNVRGIRVIAYSLFCNEP